MQPLIKWAGGARWLVPHLLSLRGHYCQRRLAGKHRLVGPFCGGLAVVTGPDTGKRGTGHSQYVLGGGARCLKKLPW